MLAHHARFSLTSFTSFTSLTSSLLRPRFRRHQSIIPVIHHEVAVVLPRMLDQPICQIAHSVEPWSAAIHGLIHSLVAFALDHVGAVLHALLHIRHHVLLPVGFQIRTLRIIFIAR